MARTSPQSGLAPAGLSDDDLRGEMGRSFRRQAPLNAAVIVPVALMVGAIMWRSAPHLGVVAWVGTHLALATLLVLRWLQVRSARRAARPQKLATDAATAHGRASDRFWVRHFGVLSSLVSGLTWGSTTLFLPYASPLQEMMLIIVVSAMAAGATTTLASIPAAANAFVLMCILPFAVFFALQSDMEYMGLAMMALVMAGAMIVATRLVHRMVRAELAAQLENRRLLDQLANARGEWLDISQTTEAFALFDGSSALVLWNENLGRALSLPASTLQRGVHYRTLLEAAAQPLQMDDADNIDPAVWIDTMLHQGDAQNDPITTRLDNGRWLRSHARRTSNGSLVVVHADITAVKRAEEALFEREAELRQASKLEAVGKLAGGVAHDFNNILTVIIGYAQLLEAQNATSPAALEAAQQISRAADRAASLTRQLLAFSRKQALQPKVVDLNDIIRDMDKLLRRLVPQTIALEVTLAPQACFVRVDPHQMEQVVVNLVINGCDAMRNGGRLHIETRDLVAQRGREIILRVADSGVGMDAATQERAFEPFFTTKQPGQGTGLGLASVYGFVRQSDGDIRVVSAPGQGSEFAIYLRCAEPAGVRSQGADVSLAPTPEQATILVVDDEAALRSLVAETLARDGYHVIQADGGAAALKAAGEFSAHIDLLLTDVAMPDMTGWVLAAQFKNERPRTRQLFMSGYAGNVDRPGEWADVALLAKPFTPEALLGQVRNALIS